MKALIQATKADPEGWATFDSKDWAGLVKRPRPTPGEFGGHDNAPGHYHGLNVQGVIFQADCYCIEDLADGACRVTTIHDDYPEGWQFAQVWTFRPVQPNPDKGGAYDTKQQQTVYAQPEVAKRFASCGVPTRPWSEFAPPDPALLGYGILVPDEQHEAHQAARSLHSWREWTEGLPAKEITARGQLRDQRASGFYKRPYGTRTFYASSTVQASGTHTANHELAYQEATAALVNLSSQQYSGNQEGLEFLWTTLVPPQTATNWPTGNFRQQLDVASMGAEMSYGFLTLGGAAGHFARIDNARTLDRGTREQIEAAFTGTGLKLATTGNVTFPVGLPGDLFEGLLAMRRAATHGNQNGSFDLNHADAFMDGPWVTQTVVAVGTADEADLGEQPGRRKTAAVAGANESDSGEPAQVRRIYPVASAPEADLGAAASGRKTAAVGGASESDTGEPAQVRRGYPVTGALEADLAQLATPKQVKLIAVGAAVEADLGAALTGRKTAGLGTADEADLGGEVGGASVLPVSTAAEADTASAPARGKVAGVASAIEADLGGLVNPTTRVMVGQAIEADLGEALTGRKTAGLATADEADIGGTVGSVAGIMIETAREGDLGQGITLRRHYPVATALENAVAFGVASTKLAVISTALEGDLALAVTATAGSASAPDWRTARLQASLQIYELPESKTELKVPAGNRGLEVRGD